MTRSIICVDSHEWVDLRGGDGDFSTNISTDHLITNVMIYYITNTISSSFMLYHYFFGVHALSGEVWSSSFIDVTVGVSIFPYEIIVVPRSWVSYWCRNLVQYTENPKGGHFAALEQGELLMADIRNFGSNAEVKKSFGTAKL